MFLDINEIGPDGVVFDHDLSLGGLEGPDGEPIRVLSARMSGAARRGTRGIEFRARFDTTVRLHCSRCLEPYDTRIVDEVFLILVPDAVEFAAGEEAIRAEDAELFYSREGKADFGEIATEQIYLHLPLKPVCRSDCRGLCPRCGIDLNSQACECAAVEVDPRLEPLLQIRKRMGDA